MGLSNVAQIASLPLTRFTVGRCCSYVPHSHLSVSYEGIRRPCDGGMANLLFGVNHPFHCPAVRNRCYSWFGFNRVYTWFYRVSGFILDDSCTFPKVTVIPGCGQPKAQGRLNDTFLHGNIPHPRVSKGVFLTEMSTLGGPGLGVEKCCRDREKGLRTAYLSTFNQETPV